MMTGWLLKSRWLCILLLLGGLAVPDLAAQSSTRRSQGNGPAAPASPKPAEEEEEDIVETVVIGDKTPGRDTQSGEDEGAPAAPEFVPAPDQETKGNDAVPTEPLPDRKDAANKGDITHEASETFSTARTNARTMRLQIPAPRGPILDRNGEPLAQMMVAYQLALRFGQFENEDRGHIIDFARKSLEEAHKIAEQTWEFTDDQLWEHYRHRRWLALPVTNAIRPEEAEKIRARVEQVKGLELLPIYIRYYPEGKTAAHIIGYTGSKGKLPTGPINNMDPIWELTEGRSGLEEKFDAQLTGKPGVWRLMFNEEGTKILDELQVKPRPGGALVTTIDLKWQKEAERALAKGARRGAMVVIDCKSGEVLVMASTPSYDPNQFIPNISQKNYDALRNDPANPLVSRAFQGVYPPASTFKVVTVLAALSNGTLTENQEIYCPYQIQIGNHTFRNHSKTPVGSINCIQGLARSNNPFMYQVALNLDETGYKNAPRSAKVLLDCARALGFGSPTGLPIPDKAGIVPDENYMLSKERRNFSQGDVANMAIGQGVLLATPLQVAHAMAGIANGYGLPKLHLVKQIQDINNNVIYQAVPEIQTPLIGYEAGAAIVRKGMRAVVEGGTGSRARISYASIAGKTGTAQWGKESEERRLAWYAGFMPADNPRFAYVVLYEGLPHEKIGGGGKAGPIVKDFFESVKADVKRILNPPVDSSIPVAEPVDDVPQPEVPAPGGNTSGNLPEGLNDPNDVVPIPAHAIPVDIDDSADGTARAREVGRASDPPSSQSSFYPKPGDPDYIPGLEEQIPRHLIQHDDDRNGRPRAIPAEDNIPIASPALGE